jgi:hypothetical protein
MKRLLCFVSVVFILAGTTATGQNSAATDIVINVSSI